AAIGDQDLLEHSDVVPPAKRSSSMNNSGAPQVSADWPCRPVPIAETAPKNVARDVGRYPRSR
ncbi:hypothetical protein, partial [Mesorhizobium sp. M8A.F.Ca.ET.218.01.1.1]|uniref:hypothetical protein n=1 Tax=Mesorhizobium sp. M8A.F.Ca.ET.218.01.1.1 TaxID=2563971 RepID=UPI001AEEBF80